MVTWILSQPFWVAVIALTVVAAVRSQATYWLGRAVRAGLLHGRWASRVNSVKVQRATARLQRWGWPLIPLSFLTVGFQTAVHLAAGVVGWRWLPYTLAAIPGWAMWGVAYAAGGLAIFAGAAALIAQSPWLAALIAAAAAVTVLLLMRRRKLRRAVAEFAA